MNFEDKTKNQLIKELKRCHQKIDFLEKEAVGIEERELLLQDSEKKFKSLFEFSPDAYYLIDLRGNLIDGNRAVEKLTGYKKEECIGKNILRFNLLSSDQIPKATELLARNLKGRGAGPEEYILKTRQGETRVVEIMTRPVKIKKRMVVLGVARDITQRKMSDEKLKKAREQYRDLIEKADIAFVIDDVQGNITFYNKKFLNIFGYSEKEIKKQSSRTLIHPDDVEMVNKYHKARIQGKDAPTRYEFRGIHKQKKKIFLEVDTIPIKENDKIIGTRSYIWDITDRKKAEEALRESQAKYHAVVEKSNDGIAIVQDGLVAFVNPAVVKLTGYSPEEIIGSNFLRLVPPKYQEIVKKRYLDRMAGKKVPNIYEIGFFGKDGTEILVEINANQIEIDKKPTDLVFIRDITESKKAERALQESERNYRNLIEASNDGIYLLYENKFEIVNKKFLEMLHITKKDLNKPDFDFMDLIAPRSIPLIEDRTKKSVRGEKMDPTYEFTALSMDKKEIDIETSVSYVKYKGGIATLGIFRDISERKRAELELNRNQQFLNDVFNSIQDGLSIIDTDLNIVSVNDMMRKWYPDKKPLEGKKCYEVYQNRDMPCDFCPSLKSIESGRMERETVQGIPGAENQWLEVFSYPMKDCESGKLIGVVEFVRDITERRMAEGALRESEEKYRTITNHLDVGIFRSTPGIRGKYLEVNPAMVNIFGYKNRKEFLNIELVEIYQNPDDRTKFNDKMVKKGFVRNLELKLKKMDGTPIICQTTAIAVKDHKGKIIYFDGVVDDVTGQKWAQKRLRDSLNEKEILLQEIHHRVKNNLMVIIGLFHFYTSDLKNKKVKSLLYNIESTIHSIVLIHEMLYKSSSLELIDFKYYVMELMSYLQAMHHMDSSLLNVEIDISKVFLNLKTAIPCGMIINELISNILKHAFPPVLIDQRLKTVKPGERPGYIQVRLTENRRVKSWQISKPSEYTLVIRDNGKGLPGDFDSKKLGSLGLTLVNMMVKQLDGEMEIEDKDGTCFIIHFKDQ